MTVTLPHNFHDGVDEPASGVQVMDNLNALKAAVEALQVVPFSGAYGFSGEVGFGAGPFSSTRPTFVTVIIHKPSPPTPNVYTVRVSGVIVAQLGFGDASQPYEWAASGSFILPPNKAFVADTPNLAACQPVFATWLVM